MFTQNNTNNFRHIIILPIATFNKISLFSFFVYIYIYIVFLFLLLALLLIGFYFLDVNSNIFYKVLVLDFGYLDFYSLDYWIKNYRFIPFVFFYIFNLEYTYTSIISNYCTYTDTFSFFISQITFVFESLLPRFISLLNTSFFYNYFAFTIEKDFFLWFSLEYFYPYLYDTSFTYIDYRKKVLWLWSYLKAHDSFDFTPFEYFRYRVYTWRWLKEFSPKLLSLINYYNIYIFSWFRNVYFLQYDPKSFMDPVSLLEGNFLYVNQIKDANWHLHRTVARLNYVLNSVNFYLYKSEYINTNSFFYNIYINWIFNNKLSFNFLDYFFLFEHIYIELYLNFINIYNNLYFIIGFIFVLLYLLYLFLFKFISFFWLLNFNSSLVKLEQNFSYYVHFRDLYFDFYFVLEKNFNFRFKISFNIFILSLIIFYFFFYLYLIYVESKILLFYYIFDLFNFLDLYFYMLNNISLFYFIIIFMFLFLKSLHFCFNLIIKHKQ